jgi:hypothetical protein
MSHCNYTFQMSLYYSTHEVFSSQPSSFLYNCTADSQPTRCHVIKLPSQETLSINSSAILESYLHSHGPDQTENTVSILIAQKYFDCCLRIHCRGNLNPGPYFIPFLAPTGAWGIHENSRFATVF